jgi:hypothetical protein
VNNRSDSFSTYLLSNNFLDRNGKGREDENTIIYLGKNDLLCNFGWPGIMYGCWNFWVRKKITCEERENE